MIKLTDTLWIGDSTDEKHADLCAIGIRAVLNTAYDLPGTRGWADRIDYMQVGLVDGPGNEIVGYCSAVLSLVALLRRNKTVMVYDHNGSRALVVAIMYLNLVGGKYRPSPTAWSHWLTWDERLAVVRESIEATLPRPHTAHTDAFAKMPFGLLEAFL